MTLAILGDSISTFKDWIPDENEAFYPRIGYDVKQVEQTWWHLLSEKTGLVLTMNESYSGSRVSPTGIRPKRTAFISEKRMEHLQADRIIIFGGTNDFAQTNEIPAHFQEFTQSYELLIKSLAKRYPESKLYFCTPLTRTDWEYQQKNLFGWTCQELQETVRTLVCKQQKNNGNIFLIDLAKIPITGGILQDGLHPTIVGMKAIYETMLPYFTERQHLFVLR
ncbi:MAG: GDSL-type esterase/lipase family protein [Sphaerochaetaceae bacterium]